MKVLAYVLLASGLASLAETSCSDTGSGSCTSSPSLVQMVQKKTKHKLTESDDSSNVVSRSDFKSAYDQVKNLGVDLDGDDTPDLLMAKGEDLYIVYAGKGRKQLDHVLVGTIGVVGDLDNNGMVDIMDGGHGEVLDGFQMSDCWLGPNMTIIFLNTDLSIKSTVTLDVTSSSFVFENMGMQMACGWDYDWPAADGHSTFSYAFPSAIEGIGDLDGDGVPDIALGNPGYTCQEDWCGGDKARNIYQGMVWTVFMNADGTFKSWQMIGAQGMGGLDDALSWQPKFGSSIANMGDIDGDGVTDLAVGAKSDRQASGTGDYVDKYRPWGCVMILFMSTDGKVKNYHRIGGTDMYNLVDSDSNMLAYFDEFGQAVANAGDINGDGINDLLIGSALRDGDDDYDVGCVYVMPLDSDGTPLSVSRFEDETQRADGEYGKGLASIGDMTGTGMPTVVVISNNGAHKVELGTQVPLDLAQQRALLSNRSLLSARKSPSQSLLGVHAVYLCDKTSMSNKYECEGGTAVRVPDSSTSVGGTGDCFTFCSSQAESAANETSDGSEIGCCFYNKGNSQCWYSSTGAREASTSRRRQREYYYGADLTYCAATTTTPYTGTTTTTTTSTTTTLKATTSTTTSTTTAFDATCAMVLEGEGWLEGYTCTIPDALSGETRFYGEGNVDGTPWYHGIRVPDADTTVPRYIQQFQTGQTEELCAGYCKAYSDANGNVPGCCRVSANCDIGYACFFYPHGSLTYHGTEMCHYAALYDASC